MPTVSVIVPTFNRAGYLGECLESLLDQTVQPIQIIVVDDGSEDATHDVVARYGKRIDYIHKANGGKPSAVNVAMTRCSGELVWLFDDDDVALPRAIEDRLQVLKAQPDAGFVYSAHHIGSDDIHGRIRRDRLYVPPVPCHDAFFFELMRSCFFHLNSALVRRELYAAVGEFDTSLKAGEDYDMQIRLARAGKAVFCASPSFVFRQHGGVRGDKTQQYKAAERGRVFRQYSAVIGRKVRECTPLGEFMVPRLRSNLDPVQMRRALLNRMHVMANHGCVPEYFDDLNTLLHVPGPTAALSSGEAREVGISMRTGWACDAAADDWETFMGRVQALRRVPGGRRAVRAIAGGYWLQARGSAGTWRERAGRAFAAIQIALGVSSNVR